MDVEDYSNYAVQYYDSRIPKLLEKHLKSKKFDSIFDCGCGDGNLIYSLKRKGHLDKKKIMASDLSKRRVGVVKEIDKRINAFVDDAESMNRVKSNSVDFFISTQVLEHVDDKKMIANIKRVTKSSAKVYVSTVFKKGIALSVFKTKKGHRVIDPTHLREYTMDEQLVEIFNSHGFVLVEQKKSLLWASVAYPLFKFYSKDRFLFEKNPLIKTLELAKIPILGYYNWELVFEKK
jgi:2-polyprenyl-3-methyl-5-hydroxy-6-metoxy-1,4-benzoquinol methylase